MVTFKDLGVRDHFVKSLEEIGVVVPTEVQAKSIPYLLSNDTDYICQAQTGTGKTVAFGLPLLERVDADVQHVQVLVLVPTRELCQQVAKGLFRCTKYSDRRIFMEAVYGGAKIDLQVAALQRPTQVLVATPGRLLDLLERKAVSLKHIRTLILDEADEMLSMGFEDELNAILKKVPTDRRTWLFSATFSSEVEGLIERIMDKEAHRVGVAPNEEVNSNIEHSFILVSDEERFVTLKNLILEQPDRRGIVFCRTRSDVERVALLLSDWDINAEGLHGNMLQKDRDKVMRGFRKGRIPTLVATDVAARGIDVDSLSFVIHFELPENMEYYLHRSGRTARAGRNGVSIVLASASEQKKLHQLERMYGITFKQLNR